MNKYVNVSNTNASYGSPVADWIIESNRIGVLISGKLFSLDTTILSITNVQFYKFVIVQFFVA